MATVMDPAAEVEPIPVGEASDAELTPEELKHFFDDYTDEWSA